jgi:hypothetical protein
MRQRYLRSERDGTKEGRNEIGREDEEEREWECIMGGKMVQN